MVTKGIIEKILDNQQYRIRLPLYDSLATVSNATPTDNLGIGTVCTMPNSFIDYKIGDIVYVTFEDNDREHLVILGTISNETVKTVTEPSIQAQNLTLTNKATLPINTHIGNITPNEIACLATIRDNIQQQIDEIVVSSGGVISVNGKSGIVHLTASDVGALPDTAVIPTKTSDLTNDSGFITTSAIHDGVLTIKQNNETIGTFSANQTSSVTLELTDTTYENKAAASGGLDLSLVTTGEKYTWNNKSVVVANPTTTATATLTDIEIDGVTYVLSGGGGGGSVNSVNSVFPDANGNVLLTASDVGALPDSTVIPTVNNGELTIKLNGTTAGTFTANQSGKTTVELTDTTYAVVSKNGNGLCPQLPNETTTTKYLRQDGSWVVPPDTNTTYSFTGGTNKFTVTSGGTSTDITITPSITNNITGSGTSGYIAKFNGANTITNGPAFGSDTTKYLRNDGSWVVPPNDNTTYSAGQGLVLNSTTFKLGSGTVAHYSRTGSGAAYIKIAINSTVAWMMSFRVRLYGNYICDEYIINGYQYGSNYWYSPTAILQNTDGGSRKVIFGYTSANNLWVAIPDRAYTGCDIIDVVNGYTQVSSFDGLFTLTRVAEADLATKQTEVTVYPAAKTSQIPTNTNQLTNGAGFITASSNITGTAANVTGTVAIANGGTGATTAANARTNLGVPGISADANGYYTVTKSDGTGNWIRCAGKNYGFLPNVAGNAGSGTGYLGTSTWYWGNVYTDKINGVAVGSSPKFTDNNTTYTIGTSGNTVTLTPSSGNAQSITVPYATSAGSATSATTAGNVTGTVAIANGGTGATTRLNACKALTNENVGTGATHFVTMTTSWGKFGYSTVANVKTVLGLGSAAYKNIQMGTVNLATTGTYYDVTFTTAFSAAPYVVADYYSTGTQVAGAFGTLKISTVTKNGFKVMQQGTTGIAVTVCWIAML